MFWDHFRRSKRSGDNPKPARPKRRRALNFERLEERSLMSADAFAGGAFVAASGSVNPQNDLLVTGADSGGGPHVRAFNLGTGAETNLFAFDPNFRGGVRVAIGDVNLDGSVDIITAAGTGCWKSVEAFSHASFRTSAAGKWPICSRSTSWVSGHVPSWCG